MPGSQAARHGAEKKFEKLLKNMLEAPPPGYEFLPKLVPVDQSGQATQNAERRTQNENLRRGAQTRAACDSAYEMMPFLTAYRINSGALCRFSF